MGVFPVITYLGLHLGQENCSFQQSPKKLLQYHWQVFSWLIKGMLIEPWQ